jgi:hypothetical protein
MRIKHHNKTPPSINIYKNKSISLTFKTGRGQFFQNASAPLLLVNHPISSGFLRQPTPNDISRPANRDLDQWCSVTDFDSLRYLRLFYA